MLHSISTRFHNPQINLFKLLGYNTAIFLHSFPLTRELKVDLTQRQQNLHHPQAI